MLHTDVADTNDDALPTPEETALLVPAKRLTRDLSLASVTLTADEARFLVDAYYQMQENRIRADGQVRALNKSAEPHAVLQWLGIQSDTLEQQIKHALAKYAEAQPLGQWALSQVGIGPVITAGLLAHIDFEPWTCAVPKAERTPDHKCTEREPCTEHCGRKRIETVGHIWRFAGLDPTVTWGKGEKRPWNAALKVISWKIGESFVKVSNNPNATYGLIYKQRKELETARNERGEYTEQAKAMLERKRFGKDTQARAHYEAGRLPPAHIHARAKRYAVKLFLAHYFEVGYTLATGHAPPLPYPIAIQGHAHKIDPK